VENLSESIIDSNEPEQVDPSRFVGSCEEHGARENIGDCFPFRAAPARQPLARFSVL
jgi:uncharacterized protein with PIN domain